LLWICVIVLLCFPSLVFFCTWVWTQGFMLATQMLYHLSHSSHPFCSDYLGDRVSLLPRLALILLFIFPTIAVMTGIYQHTQLFLLRWGLRKLFFPTRAVLELWSSHLSITGITVVRHHTWHFPHFFFLHLTVFFLFSFLSFLFYFFSFPTPPLYYLINNDFTIGNFNFLVWIYVTFVPFFSNVTRAVLFFIWLIYWCHYDLFSPPSSWRQHLGAGCSLQKLICSGQEIYETDLQITTQRHKIS
jgi:hypothetical protein